jgi:hypothetical protein
LIGFMFGIGLTLAINLAQMAPAWLGLPPRSPLPWGITALAGGRAAIGRLFGTNLASLPAPAVARRSRLLRHPPRTGGAWGRRHHDLVMATTKKAMVDPSRPPDIRTKYRSHDESRSASC